MLAGAKRDNIKKAQLMFLFLVKKIKFMTDNMREEGRKEGRQAAEITAPEKYCCITTNVE